MLHFFCLSFDIPRSTPGTKRCWGRGRQRGRRHNERMESMGMVIADIANWKTPPFPEVKSLCQWAIYTSAQTVSLLEGICLLSFTILYLEYEEGFTMILTGKCAVQWAVSKKNVDGFTFCAFHSCDSSGPLCPREWRERFSGVLGVRIPATRM